ncbi:MAG: nucleoside-diphosphate sugar epimerase/dehydratase, partial [Proteobacteria bacterium]|nr:nucleoside-diphosphate sugar epimerase/dehydratase [Pseudomonadota bacterium]
MRLVGRGKRIIVIFSDVVLVTLSYWLAYLLRFNFSIPEIFYNKFVESLPVLVLIRIVCFYLFRLYSGVWRYASINDLLRILKAITLSSFLFVAFITFRYHFIDFPRSVFLIDWFVIIIFVGGVRFLYRLSREFYMVKGDNKKRVLIIGAGRAGEMLLREMKQNPNIAFDPVGFLDEDPDKQGRRIHNVPVLGKVEDVGRIVLKKKVQEIVIAIPSMTGKEMRKIIHQCKDMGIPCKTVPAMGDILNGKVSVNEIREIRIEDLLGREHIELNRELIKGYLSNKKVLVTGAGGSIGQELCRQILKINPEKLILFERVENELYHLEMEFSELFPNAPCAFVLGDILDVKRLEGVIGEYRPEVVFHAAAYKHVPMMEVHPAEAIKNNIMGTQNVAEVSAMYDVAKFVMISTDKAVKPSSVMGASKRIAELICQGMNQRQKTKYIVVRFGNVLNSAGSVIPLFKEQIAKGGPLTVTHPDATRYFMSIPEAAQLVMQAGAMGKGGEIYVLDMGEPVRITDLAADMVRLMGLRMGEDIDIVYSGLRPGEKIHEELITDEEEVEPTSHEKIMMVKASSFDWIDLQKRIEEFVEKIDQYNPQEIREKLMSIVPENSS